MKLVTLILLVLTMFFMGCEDAEEEIDATFDVATVTTAPTLDGAGGDAAWAEATDYVVTVGESGDYSDEFGVLDVTLTAVMTGTDMYIKAVWDDPSATESVAKNEWGYSNGAWGKTGNEDRLFFFFDMGENGAEGANCAEMCHVGDSNGMWTSVGKVDQWHWKAARTAPITHADDKYIDNNYLDDDGTTVLGDGGQHGDAKTIGLYNDNKSADGLLPKYSGPLTDGFLVLPAGSSADAYFTAFDTTATTGSVRGYWLNENADGSRADVMASSNYNNGTWTVEFKRALDTGNADDVVFGSGSIEATLAITDNAGGDHSGSSPFDIKF